MFDINYVLNNIYLFILPIFVFFGGVAKDVMDTFKEKEFKVNIPRVLVLSLITSTLVFGLSDKLLELLPSKIFPFVCVLFGVSSAQIYEMITKLDVTKWIKAFLPFKDKEDKKKEMEELLKIIEEEKAKKDKVGK